MKNNAVAETLEEIEVMQILPNPQQPRTIFDEAKLDEMAASIKEHGVIQPITVERAVDCFILHDGEQRLRAAKRAGLKTIRAVVRQPLNGAADDQERLERALVANIHRADMHPIEEARAYKILADSYGIKKTAMRVGKNYTQIHSRLQLLQLEPEVQQLMLDRKINNMQDDVVKAFLSLPSKKIQVKMAEKLAMQNAIGAEIVRACENYVSLRQRMDRKRAESRRPATKGSQKQEHTPAEIKVMLKPTGWDALQQCGRVPPWPMFKEQVVQTCENCPLQSIANNATCADCGLVLFLNRIVSETGHVRA